MYLEHIHLRKGTHVTTNHIHTHQDSIVSTRVRSRKKCCAEERTNIEKACQAKRHKRERERDREPHAHTQEVPESFNNNINQTKVDVITFSAALGACGKAAEWRQAKPCS